MAQRQTPAEPSRYDKVGAPPFLAIEHLVIQDHRQAPLGHVGPSQHSLSLHEPRCGNNENIIAAAFAAALEEKRDIQHDKRLSPSAGTRAKLLFVSLDHGVNDPFEPRKGFRITKDAPPEERSVDTARCRNNTGK